jgi:hypothetical protein
VYNFGSPRVGNRAFAHDYNKRVPSTWRVVRLPPPPLLLGVLLLLLLLLCGEQQA